MLRKSTVGVSSMIRNLYPSLTLKPSQPFTIKNYMKTFELENVQRSQAHQKHEIFRVDQWKKFTSDSSNLQQFIQAQNSRYEQKRKQWQPRTKKYYQTTSSRRETRTSSLQQQYDNYAYSTTVAYHQDKQYTVIKRRNLLNGKEELVLDIMQYYSLKKFYKTIELVKTSFSQSHRYIAFGYDLNNNEHVRWMVKDIKENKILGIKGWEQNVLEQANQIVFFKDQGIFYTKTQNRRPSKLYYQSFDSEPQLIYEQKDPSRWLYIQLSKDKSHLIILSSSKSHSLIRCLNLSQTQNFNLNVALTQIKSNLQSEKIQVNHCEDYFVIWREQQSQSVIQIKKDNEKVYRIIHTLNPGESLTDMDVFKQSIVLYLQSNTKPIMRIINVNQNFTISQPQLPYQVGKITPGLNQLYDPESILIQLSTPFIYNQGYHYNFTSKTFTVTQPFTPTGPKFNHKRYSIQTIDVPALDGEVIPLTIISQKLKVQYPKKLMLKVYGFYGLPNQVTYDNMNCALLENGWTIAYAHVRGGGDKGKQWHHQALKKRALTWSDLEDTVAYLIREKYTHPSVLFMESHSAGAIAVWNMLNKAPHLFKAVVLNYPFLDVLNTLLDPTDALSSSDHAQFGNPVTSKPSYRQIQSISPYQNIQPNKAYPFVYIIGGKNDYRCPVEQLAKFVLRFRSIVKENNRFDSKIADKGIMLKVYDEASHLGTADVSEENYNRCEVYGFLDYLVYEKSNDCQY